MEIKEKPILMSEPMIKAILAGRKTMTRRVVKERPESDWTDIRWCPFQVGQRLWVRETWRAMAVDDELSPCEISSDYAPIIQYKTTEPCSQDIIMGQWRPSIFMPRWASRITLEVTGVKVERLQEITESDASAEGVHIQKPYGVIGANLFISAFQTLWDSINCKKYPWSSNPWVWVISFKPL